MLLALRNMLRSFIRLTSSNMDKIGYAKQDRLIDSIEDQCEAIAAANDGADDDELQKKAMNLVTYTQSILGRGSSWRLKSAITILGTNFVSSSSMEPVKEPTPEDVA